MSTHTPDLLKALKDMTALVKEYLDESGGCDHAANICVCREWDRYERACAAITKAEGKAP